MFDNSLEEMPDTGMMPQLRILELNNNRIAAIPSGYFANMLALQVLNLFNQGVLAKLPWAELGGLGTLEELNLGANKIMSIPDEAFAGLTSLKILSINYNRLVRLGSPTPLKVRVRS